MKACRHSRTCKCPSDVETPEYVGGQPFPCDLWGKAPLRGDLVTAVEGFLMHKAVSGLPWNPGELVDDLIAKGLVPNEENN